VSPAAGADALAAGGDPRWGALPVVDGIIMAGLPPDILVVGHGRQRHHFPAPLYFL
jgi:hypothetical protein